jgi:3-(3-hydroxy-phenyl)propionate hydroxylase
MTIPLTFGYRRFEFKILDGEEPESMAEPGKVAELMKQFYPDTEVPPAVRRRIYWHHSRTAARFQNGRVFLVGDAAHLQPPFFGQGMNSGIRDVTNLAWKLGMVVTGGADPALLDSYDAERRETAKTMVKFATGIGKLYHPRNRLTQTLGNTLFRAVQKVPGGREYILQMKYKPVPRYTEGFVIAPKPLAKSSLVGRALPQPLVQRIDGTRVRLDDVLGGRLAVLGLVAGTPEAIGAGLEGRLVEHGGVVLQSHVTPAYRRKGQFDPLNREPVPGVVDIFDLEGGLRDLHLARPQDEVLVVRPDRYVAAACRLSELPSTLDRLLTMLEGSKETTPAPAARR